MQVTISGEQERWLTAMTATSGHSVDVLVRSIVSRFIKEHPIQENTVINEHKSPADIATATLVEYFRSIYTRKFAIETDEKFDTRLIGRVFAEINTAVQDDATTTDLLKKAIVWYIYQHNNTNNEGTTFPYLMRILFEQGWLLKSCIESSRSTDLELLLKAQSSNMSGKEMSRAIRRGDVAGVGNKDNTPLLLEQILMKVETFIHDLTAEGRREFKKHPKIKELYTSEIPSPEYIRKATRFVEQLKKDANEQNIQ
jgi:hypothetical protein